MRNHDVLLDRVAKHVTPMLHPGGYARTVLFELLSRVQELERDVARLQVLWESAKVTIDRLEAK